MAAHKLSRDNILEEIASHAGVMLSRDNFWRFYEEFDRPFTEILSWEGAISRYLAASISFM
jgi:hypothetical protein